MVDSGEIKKQCSVCNNERLLLTRLVLFSAPSHPIINLHSLEITRILVMQPSDSLQFGINIGKEIGNGVIINIVT